jgi:DNA-binding transcriptional ArsR family regulator
MKRLTSDQLTLATERARACGDATRVRIIEALGRAEHSVGELASALECEPSAISKHLQVLFHARLVERRREGSTVLYSVASKDLLDWCRYLGSFEPRGSPESSRLSPDRVRSASSARRMRRP